jgi:hypothetical protein
MLRPVIKYCKTVVCLSVFSLATIGGFARCNNENARKAVFDGIELPNFAVVSAEMCNCLMFSNADVENCNQPIKLHFSTTPDIRTKSEPKKTNAPICAQFALNVPIISETVRERKQAAESQQKDLESSFVDDGKEHRDYEPVKYASRLALEGLLYLTLGVLIGDNDGNGRYDLFEHK